jgi:hypothetical protein
MAESRISDPGEGYSALGCLWYEPTCSRADSCGLSCGPLVGGYAWSTPPPAATVKPAAIPASLSSSASDSRQGSPAKPPRRPQCPGTLPRQISNAQAACPHRVCPPSRAPSPALLAHARTAARAATAHPCPAVPPTGQAVKIRGAPPGCWACNARQGTASPGARGRHPPGTALVIASQNRTRTAGAELADRAALPYLPRRRQVSAVRAGLAGSVRSSV